MSIARYRSVQAHVSQEQLLILLLREAVTRLTRLEEASSAAQWVADLHHVRAIVLELDHALDPDVPGAGELVARLAGLYRWCLVELIRAGRERDVAVVRPVREALSTLLDGWTQAFAQPLAAK